ncbi:MAG: WecB/TagA/CpsF family glycosyltransferase, partial [Kiritimatiellae bacterium]|nr:WecB/TagA/CpsF family glycosyltransferase [Kiritimatiellia bacterium]
GFYIFPSLFEGFGLSLIEAMAKGIPCACSNNGSLGEIAGDVAITFNPESVDEISAALEKLLGESDETRKARIARGLEHVKKFSWADHAKGIAKLIEGCCAGHGNCLGHKEQEKTGEGYLKSFLFGIPVARMTEPEAVERIISFANNHHFPTPSLPHSHSRPAFVATLNVDFVANAVSGWPFGGNDELWGYLRNADLVTADGMPIVLLSRLLRRGLPERVTGADMVPAICRRCAEEGLSVYVLGGDKDAVAEAFEKLKIENGELKIAGVDDSFVKLDREHPEIVERINAAKPDILFVALGNPKQELWMGRNLSKLDVGAVIGIGGTFNFIAGKVKRAPKWVQKSGLEWIYRIVQEPGRLWKRYAYGLVKFSWLSLLHVLGGYRK